MYSYSGTLYYDDASDLSGGCDVVFTGFIVSFLSLSIIFPFM